MMRFLQERVWAHLPTEAPLRQCRHGGAPPDWAGISGSGDWRQYYRMF
jgi:hypothetical protein